MSFTIEMGLFTEETKLGALRNFRLDLFPRSLPAFPFPETQTTESNTASTYRFTLRFAPFTTYLPTTELSQLLRDIPDLSCQESEPRPLRLRFLAHDGRLRRER
jgi:hypothetical protein